MKNNHKDIVISLDHVSKIYKTSNKNFVTLNNISFDVFRGQRIGIIGNNGAGKTTLLKMISGVALPTSGKVVTKAKIVSLLDLEAGFELELSGYENIIFNGLIIGMDKQIIKKKVESIIHFADIGSYIYEPFYTYSDGMKFRLACAVAINSEAEVLLFDEILISSDWNFQRKVFKTLARMFKNKNLTTIICSHVPELLWSLANDYYLMTDGKINKIQRNKIQKMAIDHHKQFHKTFKTNKIKEFSID